MQTNTRRRANKILTAVLSVLAVLLVVFGTLTSLMLSNPNAGMISDSIVMSKDLETKMLAAAVTGKECVATADEVNRYLEYRRTISSTVPIIKGAIIERVILSFREDNTADAYIPVEFKGKHFGVSVHFVPSFDTGKEQVVMHVEGIKIGRLPLPPQWALGLIKDKLPDGFSADGNDLRVIPTSWKHEYMGVTAEVSITDLRLEGENLKIRANTNVNIPFLGFFS
jgi:hypothetical protein